MNLTLWLVEASGWTTSMGERVVRELVRSLMVSRLLRFRYDCIGFTLGHWAFSDDDYTAEEIALAPRV
ncbi:MAG: hypothetical protein CBB97_24880 [Candidatus Endolissoclinum sp. TMED37]|nr:MAG: hypothetical protein CBB97_24880 [Candidatus Endolissoclinum sp. TMED37]